MNQDQPAKGKHGVKPSEVSTGPCSATCTDKACVQHEVQRIREMKTSDLFHTCNLPKRFEHPRFGDKKGKAQHIAVSVNLHSAVFQRVLVLTEHNTFKADWFNGYGCQGNKQHPFYRTTASEYGWYPPGYHSVPNVFYPAGQKFTNDLAAAGMYRNYSLNTGMDQPSFK